MPFADILSGQKPSGCYIFLNTFDFLLSVGMYRPVGLLLNCLPYFPAYRSWLSPVRFTGQSDCCSLSSNLPCGTACYSCRLYSLRSYSGSWSRFGAHPANRYNLHCDGFVLLVLSSNPCSGSMKSVDFNFLCCIIGDF